MYTTYLTSVNKKSMSDTVKPFPKTRESLRNRHHCERQMGVPAPANSHASPGAASAASASAASSAPSMV